MQPMGTAACGCIRGKQGRRAAKPSHAHERCAGGAAPGDAAGELHEALVQGQQLPESGEALRDHAGQVAHVADQLPLPMPMLPQAVNSDFWQNAGRHRMRRNRSQTAELLSAWHVCTAWHMLCYAAVGYATHSKD